jgi:hypothetical protein
MMKRVLPVLAMTGALAASGFAQSSDNVEKAVRFRVTPKTPAVVVSTNSTEMQSQPRQMTGVQLNSSAQLSELGPRWRWWNAAQLDELGGKRISMNIRNAAQLNELGPRWRWWNAAQLDELGGKRISQNIRNAAQLDELGPRWKWWNAAQLDGEK